MAQRYGVDARVRADRDTEAARSDVELVAAINSGDAAAFEVLYFRHRDWVAGLAYRFTGDNDASLDVLQETFLYLLRKFPGFRLTANLKTFLYPAVRHLAIAARRKAARYQATAAELEQLEHAPAPPAAGAETDDLRFVLTALPEEQREVLLLRFVDGRTGNWSVLSPKPFTNARISTAARRGAVDQKQVEHLK